MKTVTAKPPHHHGNLRQALIDAGMELLSSGGIDALTLRQAALKAGVSHAAPAHHFNGLPGLLTAIAAQAYAVFTGHMVRARDRAGDEPFARLLGVCEGYLDFSSASSGLFLVMFGRADIDRSDPVLAANSAAAYGVLREACQPFVSVHPGDEDIEIAVWSLVHGYALLGFTSKEVRNRGFSRVPEFEVLLRRLVLGRA